VLQIHKLCHCIVKWEKFKNSRPVQQCFNCQSFGHSSNFCSKPSKCVKCDQLHASKDCTKRVGTPRNVSTASANSSNFSGCPGINNFTIPNGQPTNQQRQMRCPKPTQPSFRNQQARFPSLKTPQPSPSPPHTWAHIAAQSTNSQNQQLLSSVFDSKKLIFNMFNFHILCTQLRSLALQLQETSDPITKLVTVIDTVVGCLSPSP
jgi:hypothetical protein